MDRSLVELVKSVSNALDKHGVTFAITGSVASSIHGEPVTSADVDFVLRMSRAQVKPVVEDLRGEFYVSEEALVDAIQTHGMANVIDGASGLWADLSVVPDSAFFRSVFARRLACELNPGAFKTWFVSPEDIILMKLLWRKDSRSQKQWENALGVVRVKGAALDWKYMFQQAGELCVEDDLIALRDEGGV